MLVYNKFNSILEKRYFLTYGSSVVYTYLSKMPASMNFLMLSNVLYSLVQVEIVLAKFRHLAIGLIVTSVLLMNTAVSQTQAPSENVVLQRQGLMTEVTDFVDYPIGQERPGTLRQVLASAKPGSTIVFSRPGTIRLTRPLEITVPGLTLDGTSNPVVIRGDVVRVRASGCILRHLWIFAGDALPDSKGPGKIGHSRGSDRDALVIWGPEVGSSKAISNITIDHCWIGFGIDECFSTYGAVRKLVVKDSIIGFGLNRSIHPDDKKRPDVPGHGKGVLVGVGADQVSFFRNILIHNFDRNIQVRSGTQQINFINNIVYGWGRGNTFVAGDGKPGESSSGQVLGNIYLASKVSFTDSRIFKPGDAQTAAAYSVRGNIGPIGVSQSLKDARLLPNHEAALLENDIKLGAIDPWQSFNSVLVTAGPHPAIQDRLSQMVVEQILNRSGDILDFVTKKVNAEAKNGLGFLPTYRKIVAVENRRNYQFREEGQRTNSISY